MKELEPKITKVDAGSKFVEKIKIVFTHQFPVHERVSLEPFFDPSVEGADAWVLAEGDKVLGFVTLLSLPPISYIFYLATDSAYQGKGVGSRLVNFVKEAYPSDLLFLHCEVPLESAPERLQTRLKRLNFYKRLDLKKLAKSTIGEENSSKRWQLEPGMKKRSKSFGNDLTLFGVMKINSRSFPLNLVSPLCSFALSQFC